MDEICKRVFEQRKGMIASDKSEDMYLKWKRSNRGDLMDSWLCYMMKLKNNYVRKEEARSKGIEFGGIIMKWLILLTNRWKSV
jgi:hypothetical protein